MSIYTFPSVFKLERIDKVDKSPYVDNFDILAVWGDPETGLLFYGEDHGCYCCQSPFDGQQRDDLVIVHDFKVFRRAAMEWAQRGYHTRTRVFTKLGALMVRVKSFEERFEIEIPDSFIDIDPEVIENDEN